MYKIEDYVVYKKNVCKITDIKKNHLNNEDYYIMIPINDSSLKINVPISNRCIRDVISKEKVLDLIREIPNINIIENNEKTIEQEYKNLMSSGKHEDLIKIIKTAYFRNNEKINKKKKLSEKDNYYFNQAEIYLYTEFAVALNLDFEKTKKFIIEEVTKNANNW